jgi:hypothetical protein
VSPVKYDLRFYIPEEGILHSQSRENLKSYIAITGRALYWRHNVFPVKYELCFYIPENEILHCHSRENLKSYITLTGRALYQRRNVSPVKWELRFISQKTTFVIVTAVKTSNLS